jgi:hypothetical protein
MIEHGATFLNLRGRRDRNLRTDFARQPRLQRRALGARASRRCSSDLAEALPGACCADSGSPDGSAAPAGSPLTTDSPQAQREGVAQRSVGRWYRPCPLT